MKKEEYPANLFKAISGIKNKNNMATYQFTEEENTETVLDNVTAEYSTLLTCKKRVKGYALKIEYVQKAMNQLYHTMYGDKVNIDADT